MNRVQLVIIGVLSVLLVGGVVAGTNVVDLDGDGLPAASELADGTAPLAADTDSDGLDDAAEARYDTDPRTADSDEDGLTDGREVDDLGTNPTTADADGDELHDGAEVDEHGTNPTMTDTDEDGLDDGREVQETSTNPTNADTDGDGLDDGEENTAGTDSSVSDTDSDGLDDGAELQEYSTDPAVADTDDDGLEDGAEVQDYSTDPTSVDSDGDSLEDGFEVQTVTSNPTESDTDSDTLDDSREYEDLGTDPTNRDTDNDGLNDNYEAADSGALSEGTPLRRDVFLELDYMKSEKPNPEAIEMVEESYTNAPVENPDGSTGITLHVSVDDRVEHESPTTMTDLTVIMFDNFDHNEHGYHYAVAVEDVELEDGTDLGGAAWSGAENGQFIYQTDYNEVNREYPASVEASLFAHELGHSVGLGSSQFEGIDSREYTYENYSSVMNYDAPSDALAYSDGEPFDGWGYIESSIYTPVVRAGAMNETATGAETNAEADTESAAAPQPQVSHALHTDVH